MRLSEYFKSDHVETLSTSKHARNHSHFPLAQSGIRVETMSVELDQWISNKIDARILSNQTFPTMCKGLLSVRNGASPGGHGGRNY